MLKFLAHLPSQATARYVSDTMKAQDISRRRFLEAGIAGAAAISAGALAQNVRILEPADKPVRVGVVGIGARGSGLTATLLAIPGVEVLALCDIDEKAARQGQKIVRDKTGKTIDIYTKGERD